jgi:hypothetical protein
LFVRGTSPWLTQLNFAREGKVQRPASNKVSNVAGLWKSAVWAATGVMTNVTTGAAFSARGCGDSFCFEITIAMKFSNFARELFRR